MMQNMRTTVDLPPELHERARQIARERRQSLSAVLTDLTLRGLASYDEPAVVRTDPVSGLPSVALGRRVTAVEVDEALDEE
jgi:predicted transcriptional regulator